MRVTINTETKFLLWCAATNVVAHLYFTMLPYAIGSSQPVSSSGLIMSLITASIWIYGAKMKSELSLLVLVPLGWFVCHHYSMMPSGSTGQDTLQVIYIAQGSSPRLSTTLDLFKTTMPVFILLSYLVSTLSWLSVKREGFREVQLNNLSVYKPKMNQDQSRPLLSPFFVFIPLYWVCVIPFSIRFWSSWVNIPSPLQGEAILHWIIVFWFLSLTPLILGMGIVILRYHLPGHLVLENLQIAKISSSWVTVARLLALTGLILICMTILHASDA